MSLSEQNRLEGVGSGGGAGWLAAWSAGWLAGRVVCWLSGWVVGWLAGWLANRLGGWLGGWLVGWLVGWLARGMAGRFAVRAEDSSCPASWLGCAEVKTGRCLANWQDGRLAGRRGGWGVVGWLSS